MKPDTTSDPQAAEVVQFWRQSRDDWFKQDPAFDQRFRERYFDLHGAITRRERDHWAVMPDGMLALLILLDQFPRNAFRGTAQMYASDALALHFARTALSSTPMHAIEPELQLFFYLPFAHSENIADQELSVRLNSQLGQPWQSHAEDHRDIIRRFGRFPHRNALLDRQTTQEEQAFLDKGGFAG